jgi:hypothetical protein
MTCRSPVRPYFVVADEPEELVSLLLAAPFFAFFDIFFECFFVVLVAPPPVSDLVSVFVVVSLEPVLPWANAPNETSANAASAAANVRIMVNLLECGPQRRGRGCARPFSKRHAAEIGEDFPTDSGAERQPAAATRVGGGRTARFRRGGVPELPAAESCYKTRPAGPLAELADAEDSKSSGRKAVPVRFRGGPLAERRFG